VERELRAELVQLNTGLIDLEREQRLQFQRIAQIQVQLDEVIRLVRELTSPTGGEDEASRRTGRVHPSASRRR
jgi:hypothetical protein